MSSMEKVLNLCEAGTTAITKYSGSKVKMLLSCASGHERSIIPGNLISRGSGATCYVCAGISTTNKKSTAKYVEELANSTNNSWKLEGEYLGALKPHIFICEHGHATTKYAGEMLTKPYRCKLCEPTESRARTDEEFQKILDSIDLTLAGPYLGSRVPVDVRCKNNHLYSITPHNLISHGTGITCRECNPSSSKPQAEILEYIRSIYTGWVLPEDRSILVGQELDIVLPDLGLALEVNGDYFHSSKFKDRLYHLKKTKAVEEFGYQLIHISEYDWDNSKEIVKSRLASLIGTSTKIPARKCELLVGISFPRVFLDTNHLQGAGAATSINYSLVYNGEVVAVMTFMPARFGSTCDYELVRYCNKLGTSVIGGASKLLSRFRKDFPNASVVSYASRDWSSGNLYEQLGFAKVGYTEPGYTYFKNRTRLSRYKCQKHLLKTMFPNLYSDSLSESEIMELAGYYKVYNSGNIIYELRNLPAAL